MDLEDLIIEKRIETETSVLSQFFGKMETDYSNSYHLVRDISEATSRRKESETDYEDLQRKIFNCREESETRLHEYLLETTIEEGGLHEATSRWKELETGNDDVPPKIFEDELPVLKGFGWMQEMVVNMLLNCNPDDGIQQLCAITIVGAAGMGKTDLTRLIYEHGLVQEHFEVRAWVKVDGHEFNLHHAAQQILKSTMGMACAVDDLAELDEMVRDTLQWWKCLIVLDGVESMTQDVWLHMNNYWFDFVDLGSKVLITTPSQGVANLVANDSYQLHSSDNWSTCQYPPPVKSTWPLVNNLDTLCGHVPLLLKLVGSMLRHHNNLRHLLYTVHFPDATFDASVTILLCVWALPLELRRFLALCAVFPEGFVLDREKITSLWAAHALVKPSPENNLQDIGDTYFHRLLYRSFFTDIAKNEYGDITEFRIPGLIHTIMQDVVGIVWNGELGMIGSTSEDADQLSLHPKFAGEHVPEGMRTLIFLSTLNSGGSSSLDHSFLDFQELESLDLSCSGIRNLSGDICTLTELRYLNLSHTLIERLPDCITDLSRLQTLDLSWCYHFKVLPKEMRNLAYMSRLDLSQCESLSHLPSEIGLLISLTSLPLFVLGKDQDCAHLGEIGRLNRLKGRLEIRNLENATEVSEAQDAKLDEKNLHYLGLSWSTQNAVECLKVLEHLQPNPHLKVLDLKSYMGSRFPRWISSTYSLVKILITDCGCKELPVLGQLTFLRELQLKGMINLERIGPEIYGDGTADHVFPSLEQLELYDLPRLGEWSLPTPSGGSAFSSLKTLTIEGCRHLRSLPSLPSLSELILSSSNDLILYYLTSFTSLSSLVINDMEVGTPFNKFGSLFSLKKLFLYNIKDEIVSTHYNKAGTFAALEHLVFVHCLLLTRLVLYHFSSLQKLHIVNCRNLIGCALRPEEDTPVKNLVVEDCPRAFSYIFYHKLPSLRSLIVKNCGQFAIYYAEEYKKLEKLEYLFVSGCQGIESELQTFPSLVSHVPCIIVGNRKTNYKDMQDLRDVTIKALCHYTLIYLCKLIFGKTC